MGEFPRQDLGVPDTDTLAGALTEEACGTERRALLWRVTDTIQKQALTPSGFLNSFKNYILILWHPVLGQMLKQVLRMHWGQNKGSTELTF